MKVVGESVIIEKRINDKDVYFLRVREYNREGVYTDAELYCRLTNTAKEQLRIIEINLPIVCEEGILKEIPINIKDSFYAVDNYLKGEEKYPKATIVISNIEIGTIEKND